MQMAGQTKIKHSKSFTARAAFIALHFKWIFSLETAQTCQIDGLRFQQGDNSICILLKIEFHRGFLRFVISNDL